MIIDQPIKNTENKQIKQIVQRNLLENVSCQWVEGCEESRPERTLARLVIISINILNILI